MVGSTPLMDSHTAISVLANVVFIWNLTRARSSLWQDVAFFAFIGAFIALPVALRVIKAKLHAYLLSGVREEEIINGGKEIEYLVDVLVRATAKDALPWSALLVYVVGFKVLHLYMRRWQLMMWIKQTKLRLRMSREDALKSLPKEISYGSVLT